ncbi:MAG: DUF4190 domain-containing protein [Candidatus Microsaccharimonas sp.]
MAETKPTTKKPVTAAPQQPNGLAIAALVVGIIAILSGWVPFWGFLAGAAAVVLGIIALKKSANMKGMSIAGIITGGVGALWSLVITIFFFLAFLTIGIGGSALNEAVNEANSSLAQYNEETKALINAKKTFSKGETAVFGKFEVKINSVQRNYTPEESYLTPEDGKEYIVLNITVTNKGSESEYISSYDYKINDDGLASSASFFDVAPAFESGDLSPGASQTGNIMYEVTKGSDKLKLQYETSAYDLNNSDFKELTFTLDI